MKNLLLNKIVIATSVGLLITAFIGGCQYGKSRCPVYTSNTTIEYVHDTIPRYIKGDSIPFPVKPETIVYNTIEYKYHDVDTAAILKNYYAKYVYKRNFSNDDLLVNWTDTISQNSYYPEVTFSYVILKPTQVTTTNTVAPVPAIKKNMLTLGMITQGLPETNTLDLRYSYDKMYTGLQYNFANKEWFCSVGVTLFKW